MKEPAWWLVTQRALAGDSRVIREGVRLRGVDDAQEIRRAIALGLLRTRPGVHAWVEARP